MKKLLMMACAIQSVAVLATNPDQTTFAAYADSLGRTYQEFNHSKDSVNLHKRYVQETGKEEVFDLQCAGETAPANNTEFTFKDPVCVELKKVHAQFVRDYPSLRSYKHIGTESSLGFVFVNYINQHLTPSTSFHRTMQDCYSGGPMSIGYIPNNDTVSLYIKAAYIDPLEKPVSTTSEPHAYYNPWKVAAYFAGATLGTSNLLGIARDLGKYFFKS